MKLTHVAGPKKGGLFVDYDKSMSKMPIAERELRARKHRKPKPFNPPKPKGFDLELINELLNSGIELKGKNLKMVEDYIFTVSEYTYPD